jgi:hypothetical protein
MLRERDPEDGSYSGLTFTGSGAVINDSRIDSLSAIPTTTFPNAQTYEKIQQNTNVNSTLHTIARSG